MTDYSFGRSLEEEMRAAVARTGGSVVGAVRHPEHASDFSSYMLQAIEAKPQALGLLNSGEDMVNALKQALEFGFPGQIAAPLVFITDVHAIGLSSAQGLTFVTAFYWDRTEETRRFGQRFFAVQNAMPSMAQAAVYSGVSHYLKSVAAAGTTANDAVLAKMRAFTGQRLLCPKCLAARGWATDARSLLSAGKVALGFQAAMGLLRRGSQPFPPSKHSADPRRADAHCYAPRRRPAADYRCPTTTFGT